MPTCEPPVKLDEDLFGWVVKAQLIFRPCHRRLLCWAEPAIRHVPCTKERLIGATQIFLANEYVQIAERAVSDIAIENGAGYEPFVRCSGNACIIEIFENL